MAGGSDKRQKREAYRATHNNAGGTTELPKKKFYRQRAHANPFSDHQLTYPASPDQMDWGSHYPAFVEKSEELLGKDRRGPEEGEGKETRKMTKDVTVADVGCGFGGLLVSLSTMLPEELILGLEIRTQVTQYVHDRISALRVQHLPPSSPNQIPQESPSSLPPPTPYQNISVLRANTMKFLPNLFRRGQLRLLFLCFPDPHFKSRKHKARIVSETLVAEYAFVLRKGGLVGCVTDVEELAGWMGGRFGAFGKNGGGGESSFGVDAGRAEGVFEKVEIPGEGKEGEWGDREVGMVVRAMREETEEGKKVGRNGGRKFVDVWRRRGDVPWVEEEEVTGYVTERVAA